MSQIAVWYHCKISGPGIPDADAALGIVAEQMGALEHCGLAAAASEIHLGVNGGDGDALLLSSLAPWPNATVYANGPRARWEFPTLNRLRSWSASHRDWYVLYHHSKAVTRPEDEHKNWHRRIMQAQLVEDWRTCIGDLERGYEIVGRHWEPASAIPQRKKSGTRFFVGNFWWTRGGYLAGLRALPAGRCTDNRLQAEWWVGSPEREIVVMDTHYPERSDLFVALGKVKPRP